MRAVHERVDAALGELGDEPLERQHDPRRARDVVEEREPRPRRHRARTASTTSSAPVERERDRRPHDASRRGALATTSSDVRARVVPVVGRQELVAGPELRATAGPCSRPSSRWARTRGRRGRRRRTPRSAARASSSSGSSSATMKRTGSASSRARQAVLGLEHRPRAGAERAVVEEGDRGVERPVGSERVRGAGIEKRCPREPTSPPQSGVRPAAGLRSPHGTNPGSRTRGRRLPRDARRGRRSGAGRAGGVQAVEAPRGGQAKGRHGGAAGRDRHRGEAVPRPRRAVRRAARSGVRHAGRGGRGDEGHADRRGGRRAGRRVEGRGRRGRTSWRAWPPSRRGTPRSTTSSGTPRARRSARRASWRRSWSRCIGGSSSARRPSPRTPLTPWRACRMRPGSPGSAGWSRSRTPRPVCGPSSWTRSGACANPRP